MASAAETIAEQLKQLKADTAVREAETRIALETGLALYSQAVIKGLPRLATEIHEINLTIRGQLPPEVIPAARPEVKVKLIDQPTSESETAAFLTTHPAINQLEHTTNRKNQDLVALSQIKRLFVPKDPSEDTNDPAVYQFLDKQYKAWRDSHPTRITAPLNTKERKFVLGDELVRFLEQTEANCAAGKRTKYHLRTDSLPTPEPEESKKK